MTQSIAMIAARFAYFASIMALFGLLFFPVYAPGPAAAKAHERLGPANAWLGGTAFAAAVLWVLTIIADVAPPDGGPVAETIAAIFLHTGFGRLWIAIVALEACLFALLARRPHASRLALGLAALSLILVSATGHGASEEELAGFAAIGVRALHLFAGGVWLGGLIGLFFSLRALAAEEATATLRAFSRIGYGAAATVAVTGVLNTIAVTGGAAPDLNSCYGQLLGAKIVLVVSLLGLAAANRFFFSRPPRLHSLPWTIAFELADFAAILLAVSIFGTMSPH